MLAHHIFRQEAHQIFNDEGRQMSVDNLLQGYHGKTRWTPEISSKWDRLAQGNAAGVESTNTVDFISYNKVPQGKRSHAPVFYVIIVH